LWLLVGCRAHRNDGRINAKPHGPHMKIDDTIIIFFVDAVDPFLRLSTGA
jgi:hypothetical protein